MAMAMFRVNKTKDYTVMSNYHLRDKNLSLKAKGLLSLMLSLPEDWDYSVNGLVKLSQDGQSSVKTILAELEEHQYLVRTRSRNNKGYLGDMIYDIYEVPYDSFEGGIPENVENKGFSPRVDFPTQDNPTQEKPTQEKPAQDNPTQGKPTQDNPMQGKPTVENRTQLITNKQNTKEIKSNVRKVRGSRTRVPYNILIDNFSEDENIREKLKRFLVMLVVQKKNKGQILTNDMLSELLQHLEELTDDPKEQKKIIDRSIRNGYQDFYPLTYDAGNRNSFNSFEQNKYDFALIEQQLLNERRGKR